jgi:hypothetical protein
MLTIDFKGGALWIVRWLTTRNSNIRQATLTLKKKTDRERTSFQNHSIGFGDFPPPNARTGHPWTMDFLGKQRTALPVDILTTPLSKT